MATLFLIIHMMIALALIGVVLLQRSEGGALGIGGGGGGGFMTGRGAANFLTRVTAGLAAAFFATSLILSIIATGSGTQRSILDAPPPGTGQPPKAPTSPPKLPPISLTPDGSKSGAPEQPPRVPQSK
jgi:preprotein translocase subunit SecG